jgi:alanine dehydrogenase
MLFGLVPSNFASGPGDKGRTPPDQITCFVNLLGLGIQFAAVGAIVYRNARKAGQGRELPTEWFTELEIP